MEYPKTNKALRFSSIGEDLKVVEIDVPPLLSTEILVKVHAASINPVDIQLWRSGIIGVVSGQKGMGRDFSGTVVSVGSSVQGWTAGDEIFGLLFHVFGEGTFSQYIRVNPSSDPVAKKPTGFTHEQAASVPLVALTAFSCLDWLPTVQQSPRRVVVRGAAGGTGSWIVQLAKAVYDCHVTAICSGRNAKYVSGLGADEVIDYTKEDVSATLRPQILNLRGAYVTIVGDKTNVKSLGGPITYLTSPAQILRFIKGWVFGPRYACVSLYSKSDLLEQVARLADRGEVQAEVQEVIEGAFDEREAWRKAVQMMEEKRVRGKVTLAIL
ncbi:GroES-like protein [Glarea lozoyensis ATCC 20868]|uniref:GroES-like protein n=1 Tax=Glarea lozoyensis (strain ATCC 20868 / MF5171) TaxID=1116229 RepID=S3CF38_GLAL2|nr:GroES-like protein [Glarea lozoyensis ATCC 20868]EPE24600.1 GroES-like protein [Glarea lozoyensis ATCC 20868]